MKLSREVCRDVTIAALFSGSLACMPRADYDALQPVREVANGASALHIAFGNYRRLQLECMPGVPLSTVWGTDRYSASSSVCSAAVHAGLIRQEDGGRVRIVISEATSDFQGSVRHGVVTADLPIDAVVSARSRGLEFVFVSEDGEPLSAAPGERPARIDWRSNRFNTPPISAAVSELVRAERSEARAQVQAMAGTVGTAARERDLAFARADAAHQQRLSGLRQAVAAVEAQPTADTPATVLAEAMEEIDSLAASVSPPEAMPSPNANEEPAPSAPPSNAAPEAPAGGNVGPAYPPAPAATAPASPSGVTGVPIQVRVGLWRIVDASHPASPMSRCEVGLAPQISVVPYREDRRDDGVYIEYRLTNNSSIPVFVNFCEQSYGTCGCGGLGLEPGASDTTSPIRGRVYAQVGPLAASCIDLRRTCD